MKENPAFDAYVHRLLGVDPGSYSAAVLQARHNGMMPIICRIVPETPVTELGIKTRQLLIDSLDLSVQKTSSRLVQHWIDEYENGNPKGAKAATSLMDFARDNMNRYNKAEAAAVKGPSLLESLAKTKQITIEQFQNDAKHAKAMFERFKKSHSDAYAMLVSVQKTYEGISAFKAFYDVCKDTRVFLQSAESMESVAASSSLLGPVGPGAAILLLLTEFAALLTMFISAIFELIKFFAEWLAGHGDAMEPAMKAVKVPKLVAEKGLKLIHVEESIKEEYETFEYWKKTLSSIHAMEEESIKGLDKIEKAGKALHDLFHGK